MRGSGFDSRLGLQLNITILIESTFMSPSSRGLGCLTLHQKAGVRIPQGMLNGFVAERYSDRLLTGDTRGFDSHRALSLSMKIMSRSFNR